jgi:hypothetical protein
MLYVSYEELMAKLILSWLHGWAVKPSEPTAKMHLEELQKFSDSAREWINRDLKRAS